MEGCGKPRNLDNFATVSRGILRTGSRNLVKFTAENWILVISTRLHDPLQYRERTSAIYSQKLYRTEVSNLSQKEQVLLAQLWSGHCHELASYHNVIDLSVDPLSHQLSQTWEHCLQTCLVAQQQWLQICGTADLLLNIVISSSLEVYARQTFLL